MSLHVVTIGATNTRLRATLLDADGSPVDLTGGTIVARYTIGETTHEKTMTIVSATGGVVEYQWIAADFTPMSTAGAGDYPLQFKVTRSGMVDYFPSRKDPEGGDNEDLYDILRVRAAI